MRGSTADGRVDPAESAPVRFVWPVISSLQMPVLLVWGESVDAQG